MFKWRNYKIEKSGNLYAITSPDGTVWQELARNIGIAIERIDKDIAERRSHKPIPR